MLCVVHRLYLIVLFAKWIVDVVTIPQNDAQNIISCYQGAAYYCIGDCLI
jgi:hypothetical protein